MKCAADNQEMQKGSLIQNGIMWMSGASFANNFWVRLTKKFMWPQKREVNIVGAYKCPKCGEIKLQAN